MAEDRGSILSEEEKGVFELLERTLQQYERYLEIASVVELTKPVRSVASAKNDWDTPLDIVLSTGGKRGILE